jgi:hypothetical protein
MRAHTRQLTNPYAHVQMASISERSPQDELDHDLQVLNFTQLRKKYSVESGSHYNLLKKCRREGLEISSEWLKFASYLRDMGPKPSRRHVAALVDPNCKVIGPGNFKWLTMEELAAQRPRAPTLKRGGARTTVRAVADQTGRSKTAVRYAWKINALDKLFETAERRTPSSVAWTYPGPKSDAAFLIAFNNWRKLNGIRDGDPRAYPDVFFCLSAFDTLAKLETKLCRSGQSDFTDDAQVDRWRRVIGSRKDEAVFAQYLELRTRLIVALNSIAERDLDLARSITPSPRVREAHPVTDG